jgi:hypothetical protein
MAGDPRLPNEMRKLDHSNFAAYAICNIREAVPSAALTVLALRDVCQESEPRVCRPGVTIRTVKELVRSYQRRKL